MVAWALMRIRACVVAVMMCACQGVARADAADELVAATEADAKRRFIDGGYEAAAQSARQGLEDLRRRFGDSFRAKGLARLAEKYDGLATLQGRSMKEPTAARQLLLAHVSERDATPASKGAQDALAALKKVDPKAAQFFAARKVKVVSQGARQPHLDEALAMALVEPLRALGFVASTREGDETLTLSLSRGEDLEPPSFMAGSASVSCQLKVFGSWTRPGGAAFSLDLTRRGMAYKDVPDSCERNRIPEVARSLPEALVRRFDADYPP